MFSRRTDWDRRPNELARLLAGRRAAGDALSDLSLSDPGAAGLGWDEEELSRLLAVRGIASYRPEPLGLRQAREAVAGWWRRRGSPARADRLALCASTSEAYSWLFKLLCNAGESVAVPRPSYPLFGFLTRLDEVAVESYPLRLEEAAWSLDVEALADRLTERTRAVLIVHPNNPTGSRLGESEAAALAGLCAERGLALISDEVFAEYPWAEDENPPPPGLLAAAEHAGALGFALSGLSKAVGLPQLKLAWIAVAGPERLRDEALARLEWIADSYLGVAAPIQLAAGAILEAGAAFRQRCLRRIRGNLGLVDGALAGSSVRRLPGGAGWSLVLELPAAIDEEQLALRLLREDGVLVMPGGFFELPPGHLVLSLLTPPASMERGLAALLSRT